MDVDRQQAHSYRGRTPPTRNFSDPSYRSINTTATSGPGSTRYTPPPSPLDAPTISHRQPLKLHVDLSQSPRHAAAMGRSVSPGPPKSTSPISPVFSHHPIRRASSQKMRHRAASPLSQERFPEEEEFYRAVGGYKPQSRGRTRPTQAALGEPTASDMPQNEEYLSRPYLTSGRARGMTTSSNTSPYRQPALLRTSTSIPDYGPIRSGQRNPTAMYNPDRGRPRQDSNVSSARREPYLRRDTEELRSSMRSGFTATSSSFLEASGTERSSVLTKSSSNSDLRLSFVQDDGEEGMSVEDAIMMYEEGFEDNTANAYDQPDEGYASQTAVLPTPNLDRQMAALSPETSASTPSPPLSSDKELPPVPRQPSVNSSRRSTFNPLISPVAPRDRYGFKKATQNVTVEAYDAWNAQYTSYLERRRKKWEALLKQNGLPTEKPDKFPPKSDKVKRYIRKGIPPD